MNNNKKTILITKTPQFEFRIIETFIAGIVLTGNEIKSVRNKEVSIKESYILSKNFELYIFNMYVSSYSNASIQPNIKVDERCKRKLLMKMSEIKKITKNSKEKKYVIIPLRVFVNERGWAKIEIALAQKMRKYQVKINLKEKELKRRIQTREIF